MTVSKSDPLFAERIATAKKMLGKYPSRIPVIIDRHSTCVLPDLVQKKFLVPDDMTVAQFIQLLRLRIKLTNTQSIFLFACRDDDKKALVTGNDSMAQVYTEHHQKDLFLHFVYSSEDTFGGPCAF